jgi:hypothetical protein
MQDEIRAAAFKWLEEQTALHGDALPRRLLEEGFETVPLSITSTPKGPYDDSMSPDGLLIYRYRGGDPYHRDNVGLREEMRTRTPLIYFFGVAVGRYLPIWPVFIIGITPDYEIELRRDILEEIDGPMLRYGLQELHHSKLLLPSRKSDWPDRGRLEIRYGIFQNAG